MPPMRLPTPELDQWQARRERLLAAACAESARTGVEGLTLERVARRAGVSKGAVQYAFGSRDELLAALARWTLGGIFAAGVGSEIDDGAGLPGIIDGLSRGIAADEDRLYTVYSLMVVSRRSEPIRRTLAEFYAETDERIEDALRASAQLPDEPALVAALARGVRGVVVGMFLHWTVHPQGRDRDDVAREVRIVLARLLAEPLPPAR